LQEVAASCALLRALSDSLGDSLKNLAPTALGDNSERTQGHRRS
jgi:hypothetical protein